MEQKQGDWIKYKILFYPLIVYLLLIVATEVIKLENLIKIFTIIIILSLLSHVRSSSRTTSQSLLKMLSHI